jgi:TIR domain/LGFP repeat
MYTQNLKIFFSYARADSKFVLRLAKDMRLANVNLWIDQLDIPVGLPWDQSVENALKGCQNLLIILSPASVASQNVMDEVSFAIGQNKTIIPIVYQKCDVPFRLNRLQHIDFTGNYDEAFTKLLNSIETTSRPNNGKEIFLPKAIFQRKIQYWLIGSLATAFLFFSIIYFYSSAKNQKLIASEQPDSIAPKYSPIREKWIQLKSTSGPLGSPIIDESSDTRGGRFIEYQNGFIYWHPEYGAHAVYGLIGEKWNQLGREKNFGYPLTDEMPSALGGRYNDFENNASIYWHPKIGVYAVYGFIRDKWISMGREIGPCGYPISDEHADGSFRRSDFQNGYINWSQKTGVKVFGCNEP